MRPVAISAVLLGMAHVSFAATAMPAVPMAIDGGQGATLARAGASTFLEVPDTRQSALLPVGEGGEGGSRPLAPRPAARLRLGAAAARLLLRAAAAAVLPPAAAGLLCAAAARLLLRAAAARVLRAAAGGEPQLPLLRRRACIAPCAHDDVPA
jgi:hypothetical protein